MIPYILNTLRNHILICKSPQGFFLFGDDGFSLLGEIRVEFFLLLNYLSYRRNCLSATALTKHIRQAQYICESILCITTNSVEYKFRFFRGLCYNFFNGRRLTIYLWSHLWSHLWPLAALLYNIRVKHTRLCSSVSYVSCRTSYFL